MQKLSGEEVNLIFDERDQIKKTVLSSIEDLLKNDTTKWSPIWYAEALMKFAGFHIYSFEANEEVASDKIWDVIRTGSYNPIKIIGNDVFQYNGSPYFEPHLCDKDDKLFPLGLEYSSSVPYDQNFKFFYSKLKDANFDLLESPIPLYALILYGASILSFIVGEELADKNALYDTMSGYLRASQGKGLID